MADFFFREYLDRFNKSGSYSCSCGAEHRIETKQVLLGENVFGRVPELIYDFFGSNPRLWILSDGNTEEAAASTLKKILSRFKLEEGEFICPRLRTIP